MMAPVASVERSSDGDDGDGDGLREEGAESGFDVGGFVAAGTMTVMSGVAGSGERAGLYRGSRRLGMRGRW